MVYQIEVAMTHGSEAPQMFQRRRSASHEGM